MGKFWPTPKLAASQSIPRWRLGLKPPWPQLWIVAPWRYSCPWNRFEPVMIRLEIPAQVMLEVDIRSPAWYPQPPSRRWAFSQ